MPDQIGNITVPDIASSGTFPIVPDYQYGRSRKFDVAVHQFVSGNAKIEQRFLLAMARGGSRSSAPRSAISTGTRAATSGSRTTALAGRRLQRAERRWQRDNGLHLPGCERASVVGDDRGLSVHGRRDARQDPGHRSHVQAQLGRPRAWKHPASDPRLEEAALAWALRLLPAAPRRGNKPK